MGNRKWERGWVVWWGLGIMVGRGLAQPAGEVWSRAVFDRMDRQMAAVDTPEMRTGGPLAWGEAYVQQGYIEMYRATGDPYYLRRLCGSADAGLANRDDRRGLRDYSGQVHAAWSVDAQYTTAELVLKDTVGRDALRLRSIRYAYNQTVEVAVEPGTEPGSYRLRGRSGWWKRDETFDNLRLDPAHPRYIEAVVNDPAYGVEGRYRRDCPEPPSFLIVVRDLQADRPPAQRDLALLPPTPLQPFLLAYYPYLGQIYTPLLHFARIVRDTPSLQAEFGDAAARYVRAAQESMAEFSRDWREGPAEGEGYYLIAPKGAPFWADGVPAPFNYLAAAGRVLLLLHDLTGEVDYLDKATKIARLWKNRLELRENGSYVWEYWWGPAVEGWTQADGLSLNTPSYPGGHYWEDVSHGGHEISFAVLAWQRGVVFTRPDMERFAATFLKNVVRPDGHLNFRVDGSPSPPDSTDDLSGARWVDLAEVDPQVFHAMRKIFEEQRLHQGAYGHLMQCYALLFKWYQRLGDSRG